MLRRVYFGPILELVVPLKLAVLPFLVEVCYVFVTGVWEAGLLVAGDLVGYIGLVRVMRLMCIVLSTLLTLLSLLLYSFVDASSLLRMFSRVFGVRVLLSLGGMLFWVIGRLYVVMVRVVLSPPFVPWDKWIPPDLHGFYKWVFDSLGLLNDFLRQVVVSRRDIGIRKWTMWLREDFSSRPYACLRPDFVPPSPLLVVKDPQTKSSRILVEPHLIDAEFRKAWMPFFCRSGHPLVTVAQFLDFVGHLLPQEPYLDLPRITGRDLQEVARAKKSIAGGLDGWARNEIKALPLPWFSGLAILLELVETSGV